MDGICVCFERRLKQGSESGGLGIELGLEGVHDFVEIHMKAPVIHSNYLRVRKRALFE
jgi:hypothetical protein